MPLVITRARGDLFVFAFFFFLVTNERITPGHWVFSNSLEFLRPKANSIKKGKRRERRERRRRNYHPTREWLGWSSVQQLFHFPKYLWLCSQVLPPLWSPQDPKRILIITKWQFHSLSTLTTELSCQWCERNPFFFLPSHFHSSTHKPPLQIEADLSRQRRNISHSAGKQAPRGHSAR